MALRAAAAALALVALLAYLRDPPWLARISSGLGARQTDEAGEPYRWTDGRASFFVAADAAAVVLTMRTLKDTAADWPINVTVTVDDVRAELVHLADEQWHRVTVRLPAAGSRDVRRIDLHLDRVRRHQRGIQLRPIDVVR